MVEYEMEYENHLLMSLFSKFHTTLLYTRGIAYSVLNIRIENSSLNTTIHNKPTDYIFIYSTVHHTARTAKKSQNQLNTAAET